MKAKTCVRCYRVYVPRVVWQKVCLDCNIRNCKLCGKSFRLKGLVEAKYCSRSCSQDAQRIYPKGGCNGTCEICGNQFKYKPGNHQGRFCSNQCVGLYHTQRAIGYGKIVERCCKECGKPFSYNAFSNRTNPESLGSYCSLQCAGKSRRGRKIEVGTEKIRMINRVTEWFVFTGKGLKGWERKARLLLEECLDRKIRLDERPIRFVDGNSLNCTLLNLIVGSERLLLTCSVCGVQKFLRHSEALKLKLNNTGVCHECSRHRAVYGVRTCAICGHQRKIVVSNSTKVPTHCIRCYRTLKHHPLPESGVFAKTNAFLSEDDVSCIRTLPNVPRSVLGGWFRVTPGNIGCIQRGETWKDVRPMAKSQVWKALLKQHDVLKQQASTTLYDRVTILAKVHEDPHYLTYVRNSKKSPIEELDSRVSDTCANFTELLQMLKMFPKKAQWTSGDLSGMRLQMLEKLREQQNGKRKPSKRKSTGKRRTATITEVRDLESENSRLKKELQSANQIIKSLESQLEGSRETIGSLNETISLIKLAKQEDKPKRRRKQPAK